MSEKNLSIDVERQPDTEGALLHICVAWACGYTREGAAPTITSDCATLEDLELEVARLKEELDEAVEGARALLGDDAGSPREESGNAVAASKPTAGRSKPKLSSDLRVADLMTREVRTLRRNDKLSLADELMRLGHFRHTVVLDEQGELAGVLSQRDIMYNALAWSMGQGRKAHDGVLAERAVKEVMQSDVVTIAPEKSIVQAAALMNERKLGCLPVMDGSKLVGILTEGDFLSLLAGS